MQRQNMRSYLQVSSVPAAGGPAVGQTHCIDDGNILRGCAQLLAASSPLRLFPHFPPVDVRYFGQDRPSCLFMSGCWGRLHPAAKARGRPTCGRGRGVGGMPTPDILSPLSGRAYISEVSLFTTGPTNLSRFLLLFFGSMS